MNKGTLFCLICLFFSSASLFGAEVLARRLSISFQNTPVKQALDEVARLADFEWSYNTGILEKGKRINFTATDWTVREILSEMLGPDYQFKSNGRYLILKRQKQPKTEVSGIIRASKSGERLANVTVYDRKTLRATTTDSSGYYQLKVRKSSELMVVRLGYRDTLFQVVSQSPRYRNLELSPIPVPGVDSVKRNERFSASIRKAATELDYFFSTRLNKWHELNIPDTLHRRFQLSLLPMVGTNHVLSGKVDNDFSINLLAGQSAGVRYVEAAGLGNFTRNEVRGFQAAGLFNLNRGSCMGVQAAGIYNLSADTLRGAQFAGLVNVARYSPVFSLQAAGLTNLLRKKTDSLNAQARCIQLAGLSNRAQVLEGFQVAGLLNSAKSIHGIQTAGFLNTANELDGIQVSGFLNSARRVRGIQIGLFNSAKELQGLQIGLINRSGKRWLPLVNWGKKKAGSLEKK